METATLAAGCFWCTEALFRRLQGVTSVVSGYSGGTVPNPSYDDVTSGTSGHAEAIQITFDPGVIAYDTLLEIFWHTHNPTTRNKQGYDVGSQYGSAIFYHSETQKQQALVSKEAFEREGGYSQPIVTEIVKYTNFYPAESYHQEYYDRNPQLPYCSAVIEPKLAKLLQEFGKEVKEEYAKSD